MSGEFGLVEIVGIKQWYHKKLHHNELVTFKREAENWKKMYPKKDRPATMNKNAIAAYNKDGEHLGYLIAWAADNFAPQIDNGSFSIYGKCDRKSRPPGYFNGSKEPMYDVRLYWKSNSQ